MKNIPEIVSECGRIVRFGIVGFAATAVYAGASLFGIEIVGLSPVQASILGQLASTAVSYFGHALYSFGVKMDHRAYMWRFLIIALLAFILNSTVTWLLTSIMAVSSRISIAVVTVLIPAVNYICNRFWVFMPGKISAASEHPEAQSKTDHR